MIKSFLLFWISSISLSSLCSFGRANTIDGIRQPFFKSSFNNEYIVLEEVILER